MKGVCAYPKVAPHGESWSIGYEGREAGRSQTLSKVVTEDKDRCKKIVAYWTKEHIPKK